MQAALERGPRSLLDFLADLPLPADENVLILVDQFEEMFRFTPGTAQAEAEAFVALLLAVTQQRDLPIYAVLTMRSDVLGHCDRFVGLPEAVNAAQFLTPRLSREQSRQAIEEPVRVCGGVVELELVNRLLNDLGTDPDQLPLMQHALMRLWTSAQQAGTAPIRLTLEQYRAIGGLAQALSNHANETLAALDDADQQLVPLVFRVLTERDTRRPSSFGQIVTIVAAERVQVARVVNAFRSPACSFLMPPDSVPLEDATVLDISHESLIRQWDQLKGWAREEAEAAATYQALLPPARRWQQRQGGLRRAVGGLWRGLDLRRAHTWQRHSSAAWAALYGGDFGAVTQFIRASQLGSWLRTGLHTLLALLLLGSGLLVYEQDLQRQREVQAQEAMRHAQERQHQQERTAALFESRLTHASLLARIEDYAHAKMVLQQTRELDTQVSASRRQARNLLARFSDIMGGGARQVYAGTGVPLFAVALSPDGRLLAAAGEKGTLVLFEVESGTLRQRLEGHDKSEDVWDVVFHPQGAWLASAGHHKRIMRWSLPAGDTPARQLQSWASPAKVNSLAVSPDGTLLASGDDDGLISLWLAETGELVRRLEGHRERIATFSGLVFDPTGQFLASAAYDGTARVWDVATGKATEIFTGHKGAVLGVTFGRGEKRLATSGKDKRVIVWKDTIASPFMTIVSDQLFQVFEGHQNVATGVAFVPRWLQSGTNHAGGTDDAPLLVSASHDRTLRVWDTDSGVSLRVLQGHTAGALKIAVHPAAGIGQRA